MLESLAAVFDTELDPDSTEAQLVSQQWNKIKKTQLGGFTGSKYQQPAAENFTFPFPNPTFDRVNNGNNPIPEAIGCLNANIVVLAPSRFHRNHFERPCCPRCNITTKVQSNGFADQPRRLACLGKVSYIFQERWKCKNCPGKVLVCSVELWR